MDFGRKRGYDDMHGYGDMGGMGFGMGYGMGYGNNTGGGMRMGAGARMGMGMEQMGMRNMGDQMWTSRDQVQDVQMKKQVYSQMSLDGSRGEKRRRDADDFDPESKIMRKLFIKNLPLSSKEADVREYFEQFGPIESCDIPLHKGTGESKGFCFVVFEKASGVDEVQLNRPHKLGDKELMTKRASLVEDKITDNLTAKKIFIGSPNSFTFKSGTGGLDDSISDEDLEDYFGQYGTVTNVLQLYHKETNRKKGVGFITFDDTDAVDKIVLIGAHIIKGRALEAQKALSERTINGIKAGLDEGETKKPTDPSSRTMRRLFIRSLAHGTTVDDLKEYFGQFGKLVDVEIPTIKANGSKATYGFMTYDTMEEVDECMKERPHNVNNREVIVRRAMEKTEPHEMANCKKIFLGSPGGKTTTTGGLGNDISDDDLKEYFGQFGNVVSVKQIKHKETGKHKGVGFIEYDDPDSVDKVVLLCIHQIKNREVEAKKAMSEVQINAKKNREWENMMGMGGMMNMGNMGGGNMRGMQMNNMGSEMGGIGFGVSGMSDYSSDFDNMEGAMGMGMRGGMGMGMRGGGMGMGMRGGMGMGMRGGMGMGMRGGMGMGMRGGMGMGRGMGMSGNMGINDEMTMGMEEGIDNGKSKGGQGYGQGFGNMGGGFGSFDEMTPAERQFMMGGERNFGRMGPSGGMGFSSGIGNAAMQGRKLLVEGLNESISDQMMARYFQKFGELVDWGRDKSGGGYIVFSESSMLDYCTRRPSHQIDGNEIRVEKAKPFSR